MIEVLTEMAAHPAAPWLVLASAGAILLGEAWRVSSDVLWGDMFADEADE